jgi:ribosome maturation factor RimP
MENEFKDSISNALAPTATRLAEARGLHLLRITVRGTVQNPVIEVILDGDRGIQVEDCEAVSRDLNTAIETDKLIKGNHRLDVLSPGIEEPVIHEWQFQRNTGRLVEVHYQDGEEHHTVHGRLKGCDREEISLEPIHVKGKRPHGPKTIATEEGVVKLQEDEQLYDLPVELVKVDRSKVTKVLVQLEFGK